MYAADLAEKLKRSTYLNSPDSHKLGPFIVETHGALSRPAMELVRRLAGRIAPRRAGARGIVASSAPVNVVVQKALIKNEMVFKISVQSCHAL